MNTTTPTTTAPTGTLAQQFAAKHSKGVVAAAIWTVRIVRWSATAIMVAAMASNYFHQVEYLGSHVDPITAHVAPIALDLLTVLCARILASNVMHVVSKKAAIKALWFPVLASAVLSAAAPGDLVSKAVFAGMVALIPIAEYVASHVKIDFKALEVAETADVIATTPEVIADAAPTTSVRDAQIAAKRNADKARTFAASNPNVKVAELVRVTGISRNTAKRILDAQTLAVTATV